MILFKKISLCVAIFSCFILTGCESITVNKNGSLPPGTDLWLLTSSKVYHLTQDGLSDAGIFKPWKKLGKVHTGISYVKNQNRIYFTLYTKFISNGTTYFAPNDKTIYYLDLNKPYNKPIALFKEQDAWDVSPDGQHLAFTADEFTCSTKKGCLACNLWTLNTASHKTQLLKKNFFPDYNPESKIWLSQHELIYNSRDYKNIYLLDINTSRQTDFKKKNNLTFNGKYRLLSVSPSGNKLLFSEFDDSFGVDNPNPFNHNIMPHERHLCLLDIKQHKFKILLSYFLDLKSNSQVFLNIPNRFIWLPNENGFLFFQNGWEWGQYDKAYYFSLINNRSTFLGEIIKGEHSSSLIPKINQDFITAN